MKPTRNLTPALLALAALTLVPASMAAVIYQDSFNRNGALGGSIPDITTGSATWSGGGTTSTANGGQLVFQNEFWLPFVPVAGNIYTLSYQLDNPDGPGTNLWGGFSANGNWSDLKGHWLTEIRPGETGTHASPQGNPTLVIPHGPTYAYTVVLDTQSNPADWTAAMMLDGTPYGTITLGTPAITRVQFMAMGDTGPIVTNFSLTATAVPEPSSMLVLGCYVSSGLCLRRRRR